MKRIIIATIGGVGAGLICLGLASSGPNTLPLFVSFQIVASRTLLGLAIGISSLNKLHWAVHGLIIGLIFSAPLALGGLAAPDHPEMSKSMLFTSTIVIGGIYGLLIELVTSLVFKAKMKK